MEVRAVAAAAAIALVLGAGGAVGARSGPPGQIAYDYGKGDVTRIYLVNADGTSPRPITKGGGYATAGRSPSGGRMGSTHASSRAAASAAFTQRTRSRSARRGLPAVARSHSRRSSRPRRSSTERVSTSSAQVARGSVASPRPMSGWERRAGHPTGSGSPMSATASVPPRAFRRSGS